MSGGFEAVYGRGPTQGEIAELLEIQHREVDETLGVDGGTVVIDAPRAEEEGSALSESLADPGVEAPVVPTPAEPAQVHAWRPEEKNDANGATRQRICCRTAARFRAERLRGDRILLGDSSGRLRPRHLGGHFAERDARCADISRIVTPDALKRLTPSIERLGYGAFHVL